ncbi:MAG: leucine-rich repeat domain-containing protein [Mycoplasmoidaceae bacterium]|nr:leucine-rich repeat domain-containing protein [Mycoplasmoidaceae bacterium]
MRGDFALPRSLKYLGDNAFNGCKLLSTNCLIIPSTINYIGSGALKSVSVIELKLKQFLGTIKPLAFADNSSLA